MLTASVTPSLKERCRRCWKYCITHPERMFALGLRIKNKEGEIVCFVLNQAQTKVMEAITASWKLYRTMDIMSNLY